MAKGMLIWQPDRSLLDSKTHRYIKVRFNQERKHDNVDDRFVDLLNRVGKLREPARYVARDFELSESETGRDGCRRREDARGARGDEPAAGRGQQLARSETCQARTRPRPLSAGLFVGGGAHRPGTASSRGFGWAMGA